MVLLAPHNIVAARYQLEVEIARGGQGFVWLAFDESLERHVAVKFMDAGLAASSAARSRFEHEAKSAAKLRSHHVVQVFDFGMDEGRPFIVMELLEGEDLRTRLRRKGRLSLGELTPIALQVASGLGAAHAAGVVHRDLKPGNIFLAKSGSEEIVKLLDFGIAKALGADGVDAKVKSTTPGTKRGMMMGTPHYMSPEQAQASKRVDHRADLWAFGVVLFRALTGKLPFASDRLAQLLMQICVEPIPTPSDVAPDLPPAVDAFFARALRRDPTERFPSAMEMGAEFAQLAPHAFFAGALGSIAAIAGAEVSAPAKAEAAAKAEATTKIDALRADAAKVDATKVDATKVDAARPEHRSGGRYEAVRKALGSGVFHLPESAGPPSSVAHPNAPRASAPATEADAAPPSRRDAAPLSIRGRGRVWIEWDSAEGVATAHHYGLNLPDEDAALAYTTEVATELSRLGRRVPLLVCLDGISTLPETVDLSCRAILDLAARFAKGAACYGQKGALHAFAMLEAPQSSRRAEGAGLHLFEDRASALASLKNLRG